MALYKLYYLLTYLLTIRQIAAYTVTENIDEQNMRS